MNAIGALELVTARTFDAVTLSEARAYLRVDHDDEDALIATLIDAAHEMVEHEAGLVLADSTWRLVLPGWPMGALRLRPGPTTSVVSVTYLDANDTWQTLAASQYRYVHNAGWGRVEWTESVVLPTLSSRTSADIVRVSFKQGWLTAGEIPAGLRTAVLLTIEDWFDKRGNVVTGTIVSPLPRAASALIASSGRARSYAP